MKKRLHRFISARKGQSSDSSMSWATMLLVLAALIGIGYLIVKIVSTFLK